MGGAQQQEQERNCDASPSLRAALKYPPFFTSSCLFCVTIVMPLTSHPDLLHKLLRSCSSWKHHSIRIPGRSSPAQSAFTLQLPLPDLLFGNTTKWAAGYRLLRLQKENYIWWLVQCSFNCLLYINEESEPIGWDDCVFLESRMLHVASSYGFIVSQDVLSCKRLQRSSVSHTGQCCQPPYQALDQIAQGPI